MRIKFGTRRLQKSGTSFMLPLPPQWVNSVGAGRGTALAVEMDEDNTLRIYTLPGAQHDNKC